MGSFRFSSGTWSSQGISSTLSLTRPALSKLSRRKPATVGEHQQIGAVLPHQDVPTVSRRTPIPIRAPSRSGG